MYLIIANLEEIIIDYYNIAEGCCMAIEQGE